MQLRPQYSLSFDETDIKSIEDEWLIEAYQLRSGSIRLIIFTSTPYSAQADQPSRISCSSWCEHTLKYTKLVQKLSCRMILLFVLCVCVCVCVCVRARAYTMCQERTLCMFYACEVWTFDQEWTHLRSAVGFSLRFGLVILENPEIDHKLMGVAWVRSWHTNYFLNHFIYE